MPKYIKQQNNIAMNNLKKLCFLFAAGSVLSLISCSDENPWLRSKTEGKIRLQFTADCQVECNTRSDEVSSIVPKENEFSVSLVKSDESYSKDWNSVEDFNNEDGFPIGDYNLSVEYGDIDVEGFANPYYKGETSVHVTPGDVTETSLTAALANSMISLRYSDDFKSMFKSYSATVTSENHSIPVIFTQSESRPAYVTPSKVKIGLTMTNSEGKTVTIEPASLTVKEKHHHIVNIDISKDSATGEEILDIQFEDDVVAETISISLGDDLFNSPAPEIKTQGFASEDNLKIFEFASFADDARFDVFAFGGIKSALLEVLSDEHTPSFGKSAELIGADEVLQAQLKTEGIECTGFFDNVEEKNRKMGVVNLVDFLPKLPKGNYTISLKVTDVMTRVSEPVILNVEVSEVGISIDSKVKPSFFDTVLYMDVVTDCPDIKDIMTFKVDNQSVDILNIEDKSSGDSYIYRYKLDVTEIHSLVLNVEATLGNRTFYKPNIDVTPPVINTTADPYAKKVVLKIEGDSDEHTKSIHENIRFYKDETVINPGISDGKFVISGLEQKTSYDNYKIAIYNKAYSKPIPKFTTEDSAQLPNSNFSEKGKEYAIDQIQCGGNWYVPGSSWHEYTNIAKILRYDPQHWYSNNDETFTKGYPENTWFKVPSTFMENNSVTIRTVGYHTNGSVPETSAHSGTYYCTNTPSELLKGIGKLGYNSNDTGNPKFTSRPTKLSFKYSYVSENNEKGKVSIQMFSGTEIINEASEELSASASFAAHDILLPSYPFGIECDRIVVEFFSTNSGDPYIVMPSQDELAKDKTKVGSKQQEVGKGVANNYHTFAKGSELVISNVELGYDD